MAFLFKNRMRFLISIIAGTVLSVIPCYLLNHTYNFGIAGIISALMSGGTITICVWNILRQYSKKELDSYIKSF